MKKYFIFALLFSYAIPTPTSALWYSSHVGEMAQYTEDSDGNERDIYVPVQYVDIYFTPSVGRNLSALEAQDSQNVVDELGNIFQEDNEAESAELTFHGARNEADLELMDAILRRFYEPGARIDFSCRDPSTPEIQAGWNRIYQEQQDRVFRVYEREEEERAHVRHKREDFADGHGGGDLGIMDQYDYF